MELKSRSGAKPASSFWTWGARPLGLRFRKDKAQFATTLCSPSSTPSF